MRFSLPVAAVIVLLAVAGCRSGQRAQVYNCDVETAWKSVSRAAAEATGNGIITYYDDNIHVFETDWAYNPRGLPKPPRLPCEEIGSDYFKRKQDPDYEPERWDAPRSIELTPKKSDRHDKRKRIPDDYDYDRKRPCTCTPRTIWKVRITCSQVESGTAISAKWKTDTLHSCQGQRDYDASASGSQWSDEWYEKFTQVLEAELGKPVKK